LRPYWRAASTATAGTTQEILPIYGQLLQAGAVKRVTEILLLVGWTPALAGCVPMMAASAVSMVAEGAQGRPVGNEALQPQARQLCSAQAAQYGTVHVIEVEQHRVDKIIVWGTVDDGKQRQSFKCDFGTKITGFTLRPISAAF
jgi:hypothetical protein